MALIDILEDIITSLIPTERLVTIWPFLLPRLSSLPAFNVPSLVATLDLAVEIKHDHFTPHKVKKSISYAFDLQEESFCKTPIIRDNISP